MVNGVSPGMTPTTDTIAVGHCQTEMSPASSTRQTPTFSGQELAGAGTTLDAVACMGPGRDNGDGSAYFKHKTGTECPDAKYHKSCTGRWSRSLSLGRDGSGKRCSARFRARRGSSCWPR